MKNLVLTPAALLLFAGTVQAHTHLEKAMPADNSVVKAAPKEIMLHFSEAARLTALTIQKQGETEQVVKISPTVPSETVTVAIAPLSPGKYVITYRVMGDDNHMISGKLHFTISAP